MLYLSSSLTQKLELIEPLVDDPNSGARKRAWIALRPDCISNPQYAIECLEPRACHSSENMRRYASELTRPRGVWWFHIKEFKQDPTSGSRILEHLKEDSCRYVQLSLRKLAQRFWQR